MSTNKKPNDNKTYRAGIVPYYIDDDQHIQMLFFIPSNKKFGGEKPQIGKGRVEDDEEFVEAALREGNEELGLFKGNIVTIYDLGRFLGRTHVFVCKIDDPDMFGDPGNETKETLWMTPKQFDEDGRELHQPIIKAATRLIKKKEELDE